MKKILKQLGHSTNIYERIFIKIKILSFIKILMNIYDQICDKMN